MPVTRPDVVRLQPTSDCLNVILKNTHFPDNILNESVNIACRIDYSSGIPVLIFKFSQAYYDFLEVLNYQTSAVTNQEWLDKENIVIRLLLADNVVTDHLTTREFLFDVAKSEKLREGFLSLKSLSRQMIKEIEANVYANWSKLLN